MSHTDFNIEIMEVIMNFPEEIRAEAARKKISYADISKKSQIPYITLYRKLVLEESPLKTDQLQAIATTLGVSTSELARRAEEAEERKAGK